MSKVSMVMQGDTIVLVIDSQVYNIASDHRNHGLILEALRDKEYAGLVDLINMESAIVNFSQGKLTVVDGEVQYDGRTIHASLQERLLMMIEQGFDVDPLIAFVGNLLENPSKQAVEELYIFLEGNSLPITSDGHFLAYKNVSSDYKDNHSGTFDNSVGAVCEMPRNEVQDDRNITCSTGLHFCSLDYLTGFYGSNSHHTMIVKINPRDVVSIPSDYNNAKGRTCRYEVVGEHLGEDRYQREAFDTIVEETIGNDTSGRIVQVDRYDDLVVGYYDSIQDAADDIDTNPSYIRRVVNGGREATAGFRWFREEDWEDYLEEVEV